MVKLRVGLDVGGTFTDLIAAEVASGEIATLKVPSTPRAPEEGVLSAIEQLIARFEQPPAFEYIAHSTTIATNALLGQLHLELPRIALITTQGFRDVIEIGRQNRSEVYNLFVTRPKPLVAREDRIPVRERLDFHGNVLVPLEQSEIDRVVAVLRQAQDDNGGTRPIEAVAIGLLHSYVNDSHERLLENAIREALPDLLVTRSSEIDPEYREYERFSTAVVNAALMPIVRGYLERLASGLRARGINAPVYVMQSNGGLSAIEHVRTRPATIIESGPASGVIGAAELAAGLGLRRVLSFDMGGTTAKAGTIVDDIVQVATEFEAAGATHSGRSIKGSGYPVRFPFVDLAEVSAGGGTIAWIDDSGALYVGPISAGADPGPACYGRSDKPTVTDANVVLGRLNQTALLGGAFPIDAQRSREAIATLAQQLRLSIEEAAAGIVKIVDAQMAKVLRIVTVERGVDPRDFALVAYGGNGPLHACALAEELGIRELIVPKAPGVFSAHGLLGAGIQSEHVRSLLVLAEETDDPSLQAFFEDLEREATSVLQKQGVAQEQILLRRHFDVRYAGQSFELPIAANGSASAVAQEFHAAHQQRYGYSVEHERVELVNARLTAIGKFSDDRERSVVPSSPLRFAQDCGAQPALSNDEGRLADNEFEKRLQDEVGARRNVWIDGKWISVPVLWRDSLKEGASIRGPVIVEQYDASTYAARGWELRKQSEILILHRHEE